MTEPENVDSTNNGSNDNYVQADLDSLRKRVEDINISSDSLVSATSTTTQTDNPGPGRLIDKYVYVKGGRTLEQMLVTLFSSMGLGPVGAAQEIEKILKARDADELQTMQFFLIAKHMLRRSYAQSVYKTTGLLRKKAKKLVCHIKYVKPHLGIRMD